MNAFARLRNNSDRRASGSEVSRCLRLLASIARINAQVVCVFPNNTKKNDKMMISPTHLLTVPSCLWTLPITISGNPLEKSCHWGTIAM